MSEPGKSGNPKLTALMRLYAADARDPEGLRAYHWVVTRLKETGGNVAQAAEKLGVHRQSVYSWIWKHPELKAEWDQILQQRKEGLRS
jgi:DNA-binding NtrC family response regulator